MVLDKLRAMEYEVLLSESLFGLIRVGASLLLSFVSIPPAGSIFS